MQKGMAMVGESERQGKKEIRIGAEGQLRDISPREPAYSPRLQASGPLHRFSEEPNPQAARYSPSPIRHPKAGATYATWANLVPWRAETQSSYLHLWQRWTPPGFFFPLLLLLPAAPGFWSLESLGE